MDRTVYGIEGLESDCDTSDLFLPNHLQKLFKPPLFTSIAFSINSECPGFSVNNDPTEITCETSICDYFRYLTANYTKPTEIQSRKGGLCYDNELQLVSQSFLKSLDLFENWANKKAKKISNVYKNRII